MISPSSERRGPKLEKLAHDQVVRIAELSGEVRDALTAAKIHAREHREARERIESLEKEIHDNVVEWLRAHVAAYELAGELTLAAEVRLLARFIENRLYLKYVHNSSLDNPGVS